MLFVKFCRRQDLNLWITFYLRSRFLVLFNLSISHSSYWLVISKSLISLSVCFFSHSPLYQVTKCLLNPVLYLHFFRRLQTFWNSKIVVLHTSLSRHWFKFSLLSSRNMCPLHLDLIHIYTYLPIDLKTCIFTSLYFSHSTLLVLTARFICTLQIACTYTS